ncbi:MAG: hypothetical protein ACIAS6_04425 [Phycisphaerales bacterium JB060]
MLERILEAPSVHAGLARGLVFVAIAVIVFAVFDRLARHAIGARRRVCPKCRYSLDGLSVADDRFLCPECGHRSTPTRTGRFERLQWQPRWRMLAIGVTVLLGASFSWWWFSRPVPVPAQAQAAQHLPPAPYPPPPPMRLPGSN